MANLSSNLLILFTVSSLLAFVFPFLKDGVFKQLSLKRMVSSLLPFILVMLPFGGLFALSGFLSISINSTLPCFLGAAALSFLLARVGLPATLRGVLLLAAAYLLTMNITADAGGKIALTSALLGLITAKLTDHLLLSGEPALDDILPPMIWLTGLIGSSAQVGSTEAAQQSIIMGLISVAFILRVMQRPFTKDDPIYIKRLILATSGGLGALIVLTKLVIKPEDAPMALLFGAGLFATYLFQNIDKDGQNKIGTSIAVKLLVVMGMLLLIAMRFYGMFGLLILAPAALVAPRFSMIQFAGLFFCIRALVEVFIATYNPNVTGINIEHAYVGAAQYAGLIAIACLTLLLRELKDRRVLTGLFLAAGALLPVTATFYIHAEPTASMLVASTVSAAIFSILGPCLMRGETVGYENIMLLPAMMTTVGVTFGGLIDAGNASSNDQKIHMLLYLLGAVVLCYIVGALISKLKGNHKQPLQATGE